MADFYEIKGKLGNFVVKVHWLFKRTFKVGHQTVESSTLNLARREYSYAWSNVAFLTYLFWFHSHWQSPDELIDMAHKYYADTALPKLVSSLIILNMKNDPDIYWVPVWCISATSNSTRLPILAPLNCRLLMEGHWLILCIQGVCKCAHWGAW